MGHLVHAHAFLSGAVEVGVVRVTGLLASFDEDRAEAVRAGEVFHVQRAANGVKSIRAALVVFCAFEVGQNLVEGPTGVAFSGPGVVVAMLATRVNHRVDGAGAAQHLAPGLVTFAAIEARLRRGFKLPIGVAGFGQQRQARRAVDQHAFVNATGLQQNHLDGGVFREPGGQYAAGRATANNDVVRHIWHIRHVPMDSNDNFQTRQR